MNAPAPWGAGFNCNATVTLLAGFRFAKTAVPA